MLRLNGWYVNNINKWISKMGEGEGNGTPLQYSCLENPTDRGACWAAVHEVAKSQTWLNNFTFTFHFHALEKETATHFNVLAWRIPGMGEPGGLPSMVSHRLRHDWSNLAAEAAKWEKAMHEPMKVAQISSKIRYCPVPVLGYVNDEKMSSCRSSVLWTLKQAIILIIWV